MLLKFDQPKTAFAVKFKDREDVSTATLNASHTEAQALVDEAAKMGRVGRVVAVTITVTAVDDPNSRHGGRL